MTTYILFSVKRGLLAKETKPPGYNVCVEYTPYLIPYCIRAIGRINMGTLGSLLLKIQEFQWGLVTEAQEGGIYVFM